jgi:anaerobic magnesium-protoporphyrin IX monomethyl ester cyclase
MSTDATIVNFFLHRKSKEGPHACIPMGPLYLCSSFQNAGYSCDFLDLQTHDTTNPYDPTEIAAFLCKAQGRVLGVSCMSNMLPFLILGLQLFRLRRPDTFVVVGGSGASGVSKQLVERFSDIDAVVSGEGEFAFVEIVEALKGIRSMSSIPGLTYREGNDVVVNKERPRKMDVDSIPLPAYEHLDLSQYLNFPILTARGCPFRCSFCDIAPNWDRLVGKRSVDRVLDEIEILRDSYGATVISILDDVFALSQRRVIEFCDRLRARHIEVEWSCMCRVDLLDDRLMDQMRDAGCRKVFLGIESGSAKVRSLAGKEVRINDVERMLSQVSKRFEVAASFILGFPFETLDDFRQTLMLIMYCSAIGAKPQMCILSPLPQAELTVESRDSLAFDPDLLSGMVYTRHTDAAGRIANSALTPEVQRLIQSDKEVFSAFYHFRDGMVREKMAMAARFGLRGV